MVGVIQGSIKVVTIDKPPKDIAKVGYVLGLRVSPHQRRRGVGSGLVRELEKWFAANEVDYSYMATQKDNEASVRLFVDGLGYRKFRTPAILINPVQNRPSHVSSNVEIARLRVDEAESLYRKFMASAEFFPHDIDKVLRNKLSLGTWVAYPRGEAWKSGSEKTPTSWAMLSVWNTGELFKLWLGKAPLSCLIYTKSSRVISRFFPCFKLLPSLPDFFDPFGFYFMYGVHGEGPASGKMVRALCQSVHNMAVASKDCKLVVTEVGGNDEVRHHVPHWKSLSIPEDLWCIKSLRSDGTGNGKMYDELTKSPPERALFVDPREV